MTRPLSPFGERCKQLRVDNHITFSGFVLTINKSKDYIVSLETGQKKVTRHYIERVAALFHLVGEDKKELYYFANISNVTMLLQVKHLKYRDRKLIADLVKVLQKLDTEIVEDFRANIGKVLYKK